MMTSGPLRSPAAAGYFGRSLMGFLLLVTLLGCGTEDEIRRYKQPKLHRMLAGIITGSEKAWFFKVSGANKELGEQLPAFRDFLQSVRFPSPDSPEWDLPAGWTQEPGSQMRFATITVPSDSGPMELTVIPLPVMGEPDAFVLQNINRWRGQLRLRDLKADELAVASEQLELDGGLTIHLLNMTGHLKASGMAPFAAASANMPSRPAPRRPEKPGIEFEAPEGWQEGDRVVSRGGISVTRDAAFNVDHDGKSAEVTITSLPGSADSLVPNVNRWRAQVGLQPLDEDEMNESLDDIDVHDVVGRYMELVGPRAAILGVIVEHAGTNWFIKLQGDHDTAVAERDNFKAFVGSIQFEH